MRRVFELVVTLVMLISPVHENEDFLTFFSVSDSRIHER